MMRNEPHSPEQYQKRLTHYVMIVLVATLIINCLSAYIRHVEAGLGCENWPGCYGEIGQFISPSDEAEIAQKALAPTETAKQMHRTIATLLVIGVLLLVNQSRKPTAMAGASRHLPYLLLAVLLLLSVIGPASYLKTMPAIAVVNLAGGLALLAICWWLWLQLNCKNRTEAPTWLKRLTLAGWLLLIFQILLGSWVSANYAGLACSELFTCNPPTGYTSEGSGSFWYFRQLALDSEGRILFDNSAIHIHLIHRAGAILSSLILLIGALSSLQYQQKTAICLTVLVLFQCALGASGVLLSLPIMVVMAHNLIAALLLMAVMALNYQLVQAK
ncbi:MAG: COX15/CtaA family protein [Porticoccus sp.]|nr:COX15/CtaA family protein [Porticoccus sp.]MBQ0807045.1 COX15/CtaA family protein [Porticoccus sp.]